MRAWTGESSPSVAQGDIESGDFVNGNQVGPYSLVRLLGEGAFGTVHLAEDAHGNRCAIKQLKPTAASPEARAAFERELAIGKRPISPMVARVLDFDLAAPQPWIAMEYAEGRTLAEVLRQEGPMNNGRARRIALQLAHGLQALHGQGLVHRDLKPDNIRIGLNDSVKIVDLGFVREADSGVSLIAGTPRYMAPEAVTGAVGSYTDIYAFGVIVTEMLTGTCPTGGPSQVLAAIPAPWRPFLQDTVSSDARLRPTADRLVLALDSDYAATPAQQPTQRQAAAGGQQPASGQTPYRAPAMAPAHHPPAAHHLAHQVPTPARQAYAQPSVPGSQPERDYATAAGLAGFVGWLGAHRFYVGKIGTGALQLFTFGGIGFWWLYDVWALHTGRFRDSLGRPLTGRPPGWYAVAAVAAFLSLVYIAGDFEESDVFWGLVGTLLLLATIVWSGYSLIKRSNGDRSSLRSSTSGVPDRSRILREARIRMGEGDPGPYPDLHKQMTAWAEADASSRAGRPVLAAHGLPVRTELHGVLGTYSAHMLRTYQGEVPREIQLSGTSVCATWRPTRDGIVVTLTGSDLLDPTDRLDGLQQLDLAALGFRAPTAQIPDFHFEVTSSADVPAAAGALVLALSGVLEVDDAALLGSVEMLEFVDGFGDDGSSVLRA